MQRVATELHAALKRREEVHVEELILRTSWRWTHVRAVPFLLKLPLAIPRLVRRRGIDAVLFSSMVTGAVSVLLNERLGAQDVKLAAITHGRDVTLPVNVYQQFVPSIFDALDLVLPVSEATARACVARGLPASKCHVVPNGVDPARFEAARTARRVGSAPREGPLKLCSVGRQVERKGFDWFVGQVMPRLPQNVEYFLAGDGPERASIERAAREARVEGRVHLLGKIPEDELVQLYRSADLFIMPNVSVPGDLEGFGIVMLEAGICGVPTIASALDGIRDVIEEGRNGHLVEPNDAGAFADRIRYYARRPEQLLETSKRTSTFVREHFAWSAVVDQYIDALKGLHEGEELAV